MEAAVRILHGPDLTWSLAEKSDQKLMGQIRGINAQPQPPELSETSRFPGTSTPYMPSSSRNQPVQRLAHAFQGCSADFLPPPDVVGVSPL